MMDTMDQSSCVPPGFRFHPTDEELVGYYLRKKVASQKIDLDVIRDIDLYRIEPWDLIERCGIGYEEQNEWYFFSHKDKKYPTGTRTNRATMAGFWKATGRDKAVYEKLRLIGMRKTLVFYKGRAPNGQKTDWIMHEYRLESQENAPPQEEGWVVCRAFKKRATGVQTRTNTTKPDQSNYFYHESSCRLITSAPMDDYTTTHKINNIHPPSNNFLNLAAETTNFMCKQELAAAAGDHQHMNFVQCDQFIQLPQLESPSLQSTKRPISMIYEHDNNQFKGKKTNSISNNDLNEVRDWRDLDKFVASQLSQEEEVRCMGEGFSSTFQENINDCGSNYMLYDHGGVMEEVGGSDCGCGGDNGGGGIGGKLNGLLSSSTSSDHFDIGICVFDKL